MKKMNPKVESALNDQILKEEYSSRLYLAMAIWSEVNGYPGAATFLYEHADEERSHMMKLVRFDNDRGGKAELKNVEAPPGDYKSLLDIFSQIMEHEVYITDSINKLYGITVEEKDYTTGNFLQWYITEQVEEESLFNTVLDKIKLVGPDKSGLFHIDKELDSMSTGETADLA
jgi:ferritin